MEKLTEARRLAGIRLLDARQRASGAPDQVEHLLLSRARQDRAFQHALIRLACNGLATGAIATIVGEG